MALPAREVFTAVITLLALSTCKPTAMNRLSVTIPVRNQRTDVSTLCYQISIHTLLITT